MDRAVDCTDDVTSALGEGMPVVALESTLIAHGMPWPRNVETAIALEAAVRAAGAIPATCAIIDGRLKAGVTGDEIERIGRAGADMTKVSRRDVPVIVARGGSGATTVAATMIIASLAGIRVFATGGIGGVHRGVAESWDVSADLEELARTPVIVVSAGAKAILDLPKTLEVLETKGVPVVGYRTDEFPAFWSRSSGLGVPLRLDDPGAVARLYAAQRALGQSAGILVANPIPREHEIPRAEIEPAIAAALASAKGALGKRVTPVLLDAVLAATGGKSLEANIALVLSNARLAAEIALALAKAPPSVA
jgi:pseudouridine-5'-phosphate glycosidase